MLRNEHQLNVIYFFASYMIKSLLYKEETDRKYFRAKVDLARSLFDKRRDFDGTLLEVNNIQESFYLGCQAKLLCLIAIGSNVNKLKK